MTWWQIVWVVFGVLVVVLATALLRGWLRRRGSAAVDAEPEAGRDRPAPKDPGTPPSG